MRNVERSCGVLNRVDQRLILKWFVTNSNIWSTWSGPFWSTVSLKKVRN